MNMDEQESETAALVENLQRQDLDYIDQARGICTLMERYTLSQEQVAKLLGKSQSAVANKLRILRHGNRVLEALRSCELTERHARALLRLESEAEKLQAISTIARLNMSVARTEQYIESLLTDPRQKQPKADVSAFLKHVSQTLTRIQRSGIPAISERRETDRQIVLTITIPK